MRTSFGICLTVLFVFSLGACREQPTRVDRVEASADHSENAAPRSEGTFASTTWANGHLWRFQRNQPVFNQGNGEFVFITSPADIAQRPFYVIGWKAGDDGMQSGLFFDDPATSEVEGHDHVTTAPPTSAGTYSATVQLSLVVPAPDAGDDVASTDAINFFTGQPIDLAYAADVDGDGDLEDFTDVETVHAAWDEGLVRVMTTFEETVLPLRDIEG